MKLAKNQNRYCIYCKKHTEHVVHRQSSGKKRRELSKGQRRFNRKLVGFGSFPKSNPKDRAKPTKKLDLRYECKTCKKRSTIGKGWRATKFELVAKF